jgi:hypothetical protein
MVDFEAGDKEQGRGREHDALYATKHTCIDGQLLEGHRQGTMLELVTSEITLIEVSTIMRRMTGNTKRGMKGLVGTLTRHIDVISFTTYTLEPIIWTRPIRLTTGST